VVIFISLTAFLTKYGVSLGTECSLEMNHPEDLSDELTTTRGILFEMHRRSSRLQP